MLTTSMAIARQGGSGRLGRNSGRSTSKKPSSRVCRSDHDFNLRDQTEYGALAPNVHYIIHTANIAPWMKWCEVPSPLWYSVKQKERDHSSPPHFPQRQQLEPRSGPPTLEEVCKALLFVLAFGLGLTKKTWGLASSSSVWGFRVAASWLLSLVVWVCPDSCTQAACRAQQEKRLAVHHSLERPLSKSKTISTRDGQGCAGAYKGDRERTCGEAECARLISRDGMIFRLDKINHDSVLLCSNGFLDKAMRNDGWSFGVLELLECMAGRRSARAYSIRRTCLGSQPGGKY
jgi:hypothetical protein